MIPVPVNDLIGYYAAIEILSMLAATYARSTSQSLSIDSFSQSAGGPGPQLFAKRMEELMALRDALKKKIKTAYGQKIFSGQV
jgi:hypothetical protein